MEKEKIIIDYCTPKSGDEMDTEVTFSNSDFLLLNIF